MALSKLDADSIDLTDDFAFTGTVTGAGSEGLVHLETQETTTAVADIKFGSDVFNTTYDRYVIKGRLYPSTDNKFLYFRFLDSAEADLSVSNSYRYSRNNGTAVNATFGLLGEATGTAAAEAGVLFLADIWLPHVGNSNYQSMLFGRTMRVSAATNPRDDAMAVYFRYDKDTTQPEGIKFYMSSGDIARAKISVFGVSEG
jgi:hypothetical protein